MWDSKASKTSKSKKDLVAEVKDLLFNKPLALPDEIPTCAMIYGKDGSGKTGLALSCLTEEDIKNGKRIVIVDLDSGNLPILMEHHMDKVSSKNIIHHDPMVWEIDKNGHPIINYDDTMAQINAIGIASKEQWNEDKSIKAIILDGGSKLLKFAEYQMKLNNYIEPAGDVKRRFWMERNKMFHESIELYKTLPFDKYFIMHEDFVPFVDTKDKKFASVKQATNQMMYQKILCERINGPNTVTFRATIDKSKFNIEKEGKVIDFAVVDKSNEKFTWAPEKVIEQLRPKRADD